jgi:sigma-54 specific flagellar transcriptional regulator A
VRIIAATHRNLEESILKGSFRGDLYYRLNVFPIEMPALRSRLEDLPDLIADFVQQNAAAGRPRVRLSPRAFAALEQYPFPGNVRELANLIERLSIVCPDRPVEVRDLPHRYRPKGWEQVPLTPAPEPAADPVGSAGADAAAGCDAPADHEESADIFDETEGDIVVLDAFPAGAEHDIGATLPLNGLDLRSHLSAIERALITQALQRSGGTVAKAARLLHLRRTTLVEKLRKLGLATA